MALSDRRWSSLLTLSLTSQLGGRYAAMLAVDADAATINTWDRALPRRHRLLVPVDVQAMAVGADDAEATVPVAGLPTDPPPFAAGEPRTPGVHLHWAMPDGLLRGVQPADGSVARFALLPDRWVVVRTLLPEGGRAALVTGWVIDAVTSAVTPLADFDGSAADLPDGAERFEPLDATYGGGLLWTSTYQACRDRFAFHDPLTDLAVLEKAAPQGWHRDQADYTVAGWWSDLDDDPLSGTRGTTQVDARLASLGWVIDHRDRPKDDTSTAALASRRGLTSPAGSTPVSIVTDDGVQSYRFDDLGTGAKWAAPAKGMLVGPRPATFATMLHGSVLGVPVDGPGDLADDRPRPERMRVAVGADLDDVVAAFGAAALPDVQRRSAEQLAAGFTSELLEQLGAPDGVDDLLDHEHAEAFWSLPGAPLPQSGPDLLRGDDGLAVNPLSVGRKARGATTGRASAPQAPTLEWLTDPARRDGGRKSRKVETAAAAAAPAPARVVSRPAPRLFRPVAPTIALRGGGPSSRHHHDADFDDGGLRCRYPGAAAIGWKGVVSGQQVVPTLGSGAIPPEVLTVVRETVLLNPYCLQWLADHLPAKQRSPGGARMSAEVFRLFSEDGSYDPSGARSAALVIGDATAAAAPGSWEAQRRQRDVEAAQIGVELTRRSLLIGTPPSPLAITTWRQPWVPVWVEWEVELRGTTGMAGWRLEGSDYEPVKDVPTGEDLPVVRGRSPVSGGAARALREGILRWLERERTADLTGDGVVSDDDAATLDDLAELLAPLEVLSASLDGIREQLLGMPFEGQMLRREVDGRQLPVATGLPHPLVGGTLRLARVRLVDTFGRTLDVPTDAVATTLPLETDDAHMLLRPRVQHGARCLFRLVDPAHPIDANPLGAREAFVNQIDHDIQVNPVAGFLLPDHIDEALEVFAGDGTPLGQLAHDPITGSPRWEPAPGRPLPPDAGPYADLPPAAAPLGHLVTGLLQADTRARHGGDAPEASALSELLRAIDTTLWSVDTFAALGTPSIAALVGRPVAVVRATLRLETPDDVDEVVVEETGGAAARRQRFAALADHQFVVRLGSIERSDDSLLAFVVDDDYRHVRVVDKAVAAHARAGGRHEGYLGPLGRHGLPDERPLSHPYLLAEDELLLRPGQTLRLTMLMLPAGLVHLTTGILPRKVLRLADEWVTPGLRRLMPSVRVGPVLVDPAEIRMPKVNALGDRQQFTRRTGPLSWRDDPITAASQAALLPRIPHEAQEGWVRVIPQEEEPS